MPSKFKTKVYANLMLHDTIMEIKYNHWGKLLRLEENDMFTLFSFVCDRED